MFHRTSQGFYSNLMPCLFSPPTPPLDVAGLGHLLSAGHRLRMNENWPLLLGIASPNRGGSGITFLRQGFDLEEAAALDALDTLMYFVGSLSCRGLRAEWVGQLIVGC